MKANESTVGRFEALLKKKNKYLHFFFGSGIVFAFFWIVGVFLSFVNKEFGSFLLYCSVILIIIFAGLAFLMFFSYHVDQSIFRLFKSYTWHIVVSDILIFLCCIFYAMGIVIINMATSFSSFYKVDPVKVQDVQGNKIIIDSSMYNYGDSQTIDIYKPFFAPVQKGDIIYVRYSESQSEKKYYVLDDQIGSIIMAIGIIWGPMLVILWLYSLKFYFFLTSKSS